MRFLTAAALSAGLMFAGAAQAHGTIISPATRAYQCWQAWGSQHTNPAMQQQDPMCYRAFQANPDTMWNWMSALRDGLGGQFQAAGPAADNDGVVVHPRPRLSAARLWACL